MKTVKQQMASISVLNFLFFVSINFRLKDSFMRPAMTIEVEEAKGSMAANYKKANSGDGVAITQNY